MKVQWPLHVDGAVEYAGPLVGVEGRVVIVADVAHRAQIVAAKFFEKNGGKISITWRQEKK
jgi:hypothetical protein